VQMLGMCPMSSAWGFALVQVRIPGPAAPPRTYGYVQSSGLSRNRSDSEPRLWRDASENDKSMDGARGFGLLDDSFEEGSDASKPKAPRRQSNYSNGSSAVTDHERLDRGGGNRDDEYDRGSAYLRSWLFTVRRVLTTYYFVTSFVLIFFFALKVPCDRSRDRAFVRWGLPMVTWLHCCRRVWSWRSLWSRPCCKL
jgi:hypothetical protein